MFIQDILGYTDEDINKGIREDFRASEDDRALKNDQNWMANQMYHCREILTPGMFGGDDKTGGKRMEARSPLAMLNAPIPNKAYVPWLRGVVLACVARISSALWPDYEDFFRVEATHPDDEETTELIYHALMHYLRSSKYKQETVLTLVQAALFDFSILYTGWRVDFGYAPKKLQKHRQVRDPISGERVDLSSLEEARQRYQWERGAVQGFDVWTVNTFNFRYDPMAGHDGMDACEWAGLTYPMSKRRMVELVQANQWPDSVLDPKTGIAEDEPMNDNDDVDTTKDWDAKLKQDERLSSDDSRVSNENKHFVRVRQYCTKNAMVYQLNGRVLVRPKTPSSELGRTLGWPFHKVTFMPIQGMFSGTSLAQPLMPIQHDINQMHRLMRAAQDKAIRLDRLVDGTFFNSAEEAESQPWGTGTTIVLPKNPQGRDPQSAVRFVGYPGNQAPDMWNSIAAQMEGGERASGVSANVQTAGTGGGTRSATEIGEISEGVNMQSSFREKQIEQAVVVEVLQRLLRLIHINVGEAMFVKIRGKQGGNWRQIMPADLILTQSPEIVALGMSSMASRGTAGQILRDAIIAFASNPVFAQHLKVIPSLRAFLRSMDVDPDEIVNDIGSEHKLPQEWENIMLANGYTVAIHPADNHQQHLEEIIQFVNSPAFDDVPEANRQKFMDHAMLHKQAAESGGRALGAPSPTGAQTIAGGGGVNAPTQQIPNAPEAAAPAGAAPVPAVAAPAPAPAAGGNP
jgi:hypothetical protein